MRRRRHVPAGARRPGLAHRRELALSPRAAASDRRAALARRLPTWLTPLLRPSRPAAGPALGRGVAFRGTVWEGGDAASYDGAVVVDGRGDVVALGPDRALPAGLRVVAGAWVGPGVVDAHVHLAFGDLEGGVVGARDLGAPGWCCGGDAPGPVRPVRRTGVAVAGPLLTAAGGYPTRSWGSGGFAALLSSPEQARTLVGDLVAEGVDLLKVALEPADGLPVPTPDQVHAVVDAAHAAGLGVTAHALTAAMVARALDARVDELCHTPVEVLPDHLVQRIADAGVAVVSTLQTLSTGGYGPARNAAALHARGVRLLYGTDLGNAGTRPGVDPRELDRLADSGMGRLGALRAATEGAAQALGMRDRTGRLRVGEAAALVVLPADPLVAPEAWRTPVAVLVDGVLRVGEDLGRLPRTRSRGGG